MYKTIKDMLGLLKAARNLGGSKVRNLGRGA